MRPGRNCALPRRESYKFFTLVNPAQGTRFVSPAVALKAVDKLLGPAPPAKAWLPRLRERGKEGAAYIFPDADPVPRSWGASKL